MSDMWDAAAAGWEANAEFVDRHLGEATERMLDAAGVATGSAVLDLASGPGGAGLAAARRVGPTGRVVLADVAPKMVEAAARRATALENVETCVCDQSDIPFDDGSFDAVIVRHGLMFASDPAHAASNAVRVLRPGGRYAAMTWGPREQNPWLGLVLDAVSEELGTPFPPPQIPGPFSLDEPDTLAATLADGGLEDVAVSSLPTPMPADSVQGWWERVPRLAGPLAAALAAMQAPMREAIERRALDAAAREVRHEGEQVVFAGCVLIASGAAPRSAEA